MSGRGHSTKRWRGQPVWRLRYAVLPGGCERVRLFGDRACHLGHVTSGMSKPRRVSTRQAWGQPRGGGVAEGAMRGRRIGGDGIGLATGRRVLGRVNNQWAMSILDL